METAEVSGGMVALGLCAFSCFWQFLRRISEPTLQSCLRGHRAFSVCVGIVVRAVEFELMISGW